MHAITQRKAHFLMRISEQTQGLAKRTQQLGPDDWLVEFHPNARCRRENPAMPETLKFRLIRYQLPGFRPSWLLTSLLDPQSFSYTELVAFYHQRWRIERIYCEWKHALDIQNLRSHTPAGIIKELHAQVLLSNLVRWVMSDAVEDTGKTTVEFSFECALTALENALIKMLRASPSQIQQIYAELLAEIRRAPIRQRPGRHYPRPREGKIKNKGHGKYVLPARLSPLT